MAGRGSKKIGGMIMMVICLLAVIGILHPSQGIETGGAGQGAQAEITEAFLTEKPLAKMPSTKPQSEQAAPSLTDGEMGQLTVRFLDVGEGNATLLESDGHYVLVDGGDRDKSSYVVAYLKRLGITSLDAVVISHFDADHLNGIVGALHVFSAGIVLSPSYKTDTRVFLSYQNIIQEKGLSVHTPLPGDTYDFGSASFTVVGPIVTEGMSENDQAICIRITNGQYSFLLTADASSDAEYEMVRSGQQLHSDVMEVGHHGSATSTSDVILDAARPSYMVLSCGINNSYGHPAESTMERIESRAIPLYRTDTQGTITATCMDDGIVWSTER